jgi:hypothetical protein
MPSQGFINEGKDPRRRNAQFRRRFLDVGQEFRVGDDDLCFGDFQRMVKFERCIGWVRSNPDTTASNDRLD